MLFFSHAQQAFQNLAASKLRSFLAILGILVGTASVVALLSCGQLATEKALAQFKTLGTDLLAVSAFPSREKTSASDRERITLTFWRGMPARIASIAQIAPYSTTYPEISFQGKVLQGTVIGAEETLAAILHLHLASGYFVSYLNSFEHFCVIGDHLARQLREFSLDNPLGKQLLIGRTVFTIIGTIKPWKESSFFNEDINQSVIIPITAMALISKESKINQAVILLKPKSPIDDTVIQIKQLIASQSPNLIIFTRSAKQIIASMENQGRIFTLLLAVIGGISLLVGGIGVMNIMLVSVSERKKEIGIRKAVGAKNREIQALFLIEALCLSLLGGTLGIGFGLLITYVIAYFSQWSFTIFLLPTVGGFAVSVITGIFFGFYPAKRAARLEPIVSLRSA